MMKNALCRGVLAAMFMMGGMAAPAFGAATVPGGCYLTDGLEVRFTYKFLYDNIDTYAPTVFFGGVAAPAAQFYPKFFFDEEDGTELDRWSELRCTAPPSSVGGVVDLQVVFTPLSPEVPETLPIDFPEGFEYYDAPAVTRLDPDNYSIMPEEVPVKIYGRGFARNGPVAAYFGGYPAADIAVNADGTQLTCMPPDFPGGTWPLNVDVRVVNPSGSGTTVEGGFTYERLTPVIARGGREVKAWTTNQGVLILVDRVVDGPVQAYIGGILGKNTSIYTIIGRSIFTVAPALPPGTYDVTIVNGDGGTATKIAAQWYVGTPSTDFHAGDVDQDFRFSLSEVLRVCQFYNVGGYHCDASSEDGYAPGLDGDRSCAPYPSDTDPQNWQIDLAEVMEIIQFYNLHCYQPCDGAPGTYCPPDPLF